VPYLRSCGWISYPSLLAYQFAVLSAVAQPSLLLKLRKSLIYIEKFGGQITEHLAQMLNFIVKRTSAVQQLILVVEESPTGLVFEGPTIELTMPFGLLDASQYQTISEELKSLVSEISAGVDARLANHRIQAISEPSK
jgi:hypothetical protein